MPGERKQSTPRHPRSPLPRQQIVRESAKKIAPARPPLPATPRKPGSGTGAPAAKRPAVQEPPAGEETRDVR